MYKKDQNVKRFIENYGLGIYDTKNVTAQIKAGWYDWHCKNSSLMKKTQRIGNIVKKIKPFGKIDLDKWYVWFKNTKPIKGRSYDDFRFSDLETGIVFFTIQMDCHYNKNKYVVYGRTPDDVFHREIPIFETNSVKKLIQWLNTAWES